MGIYCDVISDVGLGTSTAKTELSGDRSGNSTDYVLPAAAKAILYVQPYIYQTTPTANQSLLATCKVESDDLGIKDFEVFASPLGTNVATTDNTNSDLQRTAIYPVMFRTLGGEKVQVYGIPQIANAAAPNEGAMIWWSDNPNEITDRPFRAKVGGTAGGAASTTSTGTATGSVTGATITLAGQPLRFIRSIFGVVTETTTAAVKPIAGWFSISAPEMAFVLRAPFEPVQGHLGTAQSNTHLTRVDGLNAAVQPPSTIVTAMQVTAAPSTAGNFANGILYN